MKLYVKIKEGKIVEACPDKLEGAEVITCTEADFRQIQEQFTAYVKGGKITEIKAEKHREKHLENLAKIEEEKAKEEAEAKAKEAKEKDNNLTPIIDV